MIAKVWTNETLTGFCAHAFFAGWFVDRWSGDEVWAAVVVTVCAIGKEFLFDEWHAQQSRYESFLDFTAYAIGAWATAVIDIFWRHL